MKKAKNPWLVTFSDLITLLITFFTLIIAMSSMDEKALKESFTFFSGGPGIMDYGNKLNEDLKSLQIKYNLSKTNISAIKELINKFSLMPSQALKLLFLKNKIKEFKYRLIIKNHRDVYLFFNCDNFFYPVSINLNQNGIKFAQQINNILKTYKGLVIFKAFTTKFPIENDLIKNNVDFSIKRLSKLIDFLIKKNINYNRILIMGWGKEKKPDFILKNGNIIEIELKNYLKI